MAGTETYGGCCPKCLKGMEQKFESSWSGFIFDACPWCGFIYVGEGKETSKEEASRSWEAILEHFQVATRQELIEKYNLETYTPQENKEFFPSIWDCSDINGVQLMYKLLWRQYASNQEKPFSVEGLRVYYGDDKTEEGTILEYKEGQVQILWDKNKGSKLPYFSYPATEVGENIHLVEPLSFV